jgi:hypothetical protein
MTSYPADDVRVTKSLHPHSPSRDLRISQQRRKIRTLAAGKPRSSVYALSIDRELPSLPVGLHVAGVRPSRHAGDAQTSVVAVVR